MKLVNVRIKSRSMVLRSLTTSAILSAHSYHRPVRSLSGKSRVLLWVVALAYLVTGIPWFVAPAFSAERFPWKVTPFMAMTIGGWCVGNAWVAWYAARVWRWGLVRPVLIYLWAFGLLEAAVLVLFVDKLRLDTWMAWPYLMALVLTIISAVLGAVDWARLRPSIMVEGPRVPTWWRVGVVVFMIFVGFLAAVAAVSNGAPDERVFPEPMTAFTLRAFGAFYLSLVIGALSLVRARTIGPILNFGAAELGVVIVITAAIVPFAGVFAINRHPLQLLYIGAYVVVMIVTAASLFHHRKSLRPAA